ncbi:hypothetical protein [Sphingopyxis sp. PET50]|uniref:hypothetical protein n=1 Tax=Sphingopyxis sp. PET50 TaxID=2976533 RepID=UPI0028A5F5B6|nr:hypothetical protein [Sphingopyxis sp. PET50]
MARGRQRHHADHRPIGAVPNHHQPRLPLGVEQVERRLQAPAFDERIGLARLAGDRIPRRGERRRQRERIDDAHGQRRGTRGHRRAIDGKGGVDRHRGQASRQGLR